MLTPILFNLYLLFLCSSSFFSTDYCQDITHHAVPQAVLTTHRSDALGIDCSMTRLLVIARCKVPHGGADPISSRKWSERTPLPLCNNIWLLCCRFADIAYRIGIGYHHFIIIISVWWNLRKVIRRMQKEWRVFMTSQCPTKQKLIW